ncbi:MAG: flavin reductase [Lachnospiraceae bacterium]|jgi:flavin reductase (DIM6/NTAB) family NADH-FMN oxidoreductase RutF/rubredoxin|nr:flavin reductase [Lachnospiraceae bacterium]MCH4032243.1 flavin reductase [Lachnospiraceae bacterium]MCH4108879.1 flavin reductase [Lachnospiraceae bacterium]MCI1303135.1 flavin reductase [Lachnospiraceae bacterium]MCI1332678.1 flavin reductase [Lachnospiraceae bacterium]
MDKKAMYKLTYGLFVITVRGEKDNGCIINTAIQAASNPNTITVCLNKTDFTSDILLETGVFNISVLSEKAPFAVFKRFGYQSGRDVDKFADYSGMERTENGVYRITEGVNAWISCKVRQTVDLGSHTMFIADVTDMEVTDDTPSVTYAYYMDNIKPKPEKTAGTTGQVVWRCKICGYEYVGEELPADFVCPICKHPASDFERIVK